VDLCSQVGSVKYQMAIPDDLVETARLVDAAGRRIVACEADVRDPDALDAAVAKGVAELGRVDIVLANAGIAPTALVEEDPIRVFQDTIAVNLFGVRHTVHAAAQTMIDQGVGGAIVITSSTMGLAGRGGNGSGAKEGYAAAKHGVVGLMRSYAHWLAPHNIRVNTVHPTGVNTPMIRNDVIREAAAALPGMAGAMSNLMPVDAVEAEDVSNAILFLVSDMGRYVTGVTLPVDAGFVIK